MAPSEGPRRQIEAPLRGCQGLPGRPQAKQVAELPLMCSALGPRGLTSQAPCLLLGIRPGETHAPPGLHAPSTPLPHPAPLRLSSKALGNGSSLGICCTFAFFFFLKGTVFTLMMLHCSPTLQLPKSTRSCQPPWRFQREPPLWTPFYRGPLLKIERSSAKGHEGSASRLGEHRHPAGSGPLPVTHSVWEGWLGVSPPLPPTTEGLEISRYLKGRSVAVFPDLSRLLNR